MGDLESIASKIGRILATPLDWIKRSEIGNGIRNGTTWSEREREIKALHRAKEILRPASAFFFAQAALDREPKK